MSHIDELFTELDEKETMKIERPMNKEKQQHFEDMIMKSILNEIVNADDNICPDDNISANDNISSYDYISSNENKITDQNKNIFENKVTDVNNGITLLIKYKNRFFKKKFIAILLAATLLLGMTVYAAEKNEWDIAIVNFMGISNANTVQLEDGVVEIRASASSNGVTMKAVTSVGDKNSAYIRIDTDYKLPETFNVGKDYIITNGWDINITKNKMEMNTDHMGSMSYFDNNGFLSFMMYIGNCDGINRKNVKITLSDLYIYHDLGTEDNQVDHGTLLLNGKWILSWKYNYRSNVDTYYPMKEVVSNGDACLVTKIEVSPITIHAEALKNPWKGSTETSRLVISKITMKDGSVIDFDRLSTSGGCKNNTFLEGYRDVMEMGEAIEPSEVYSITIGDTEIIL